MKRALPSLTGVASIVWLAWLVIATAAAAPFAFRQDNLVSDQSGVALTTDPNLRNPWGLASTATSPIWVSNQLTGTSTLYNGAGVPQPLVVTIPSSGPSPTGPTGVVVNTTSDFALSVGGRALFLFGNLDGTLSGWNSSSGTSAQIVGASAGSSYTGLALGRGTIGNVLYAADSAQNQIDVYTATFTETFLSGSFDDPTVPAGFSVYNVQSIGGQLLVTYENESAGGGIVDAFDFDGNFLRRVAGNGAVGPLQSPWGLAIAPASFGPFAGALLVGNEDDGRISAFDFATGTFLGQLLDANGDPLANPGLWGLLPGNGGNGGSVDRLYFAAGIGGEAHGLFGSIAPVATTVAEPASPALITAALAALLVSLAVRRGRGARLRA